MARASALDLDPDAVFPLLAFLLDEGVKAEQRFGPSTTEVEKITDLDIGSGRTPLQMMVSAGAKLCTALLLQSRASVATYDSSGWTPLLVVSMFTSIFTF